MIERQRTMCRRSQHIAAASGSPGPHHPPGTMGTTTMSPCASLYRTVILATAVCLICVCRGVASDEEPHESAEVVHTLWDDENPEIRDVSLEGMDEGMDMMDREARKISRAYLQGLIRKKEREALERLPVEERAKKKVELRARQRQEIESRLKRRNEKPMQIVSPFFQKPPQPSAVSDEETVGSKNPEEIAVPASAPDTTLTPEMEGTSTYKPTASVQDEEHIALAPSETTIEPAISTESASSPSQQATGAPPTSTESQELESRDVTRRIMNLRGDIDVTAEEKTTPSALEKDLITEESGTFELATSTTVPPYFDVESGMDALYSTTKSTALEPWTKPELGSWSTTPGPTKPELWMYSTILGFRHQPTTPAPWNESIVHGWHNQPTTPRSWTEISTSELPIQSSTYAEPNTHELWPKLTTYGLQYQPTTAASTTPQPCSDISTLGCRVQPTYEESTTPEPWTESTNQDLLYQTNIGTPTTSEPRSDKTTSELRTQPTYAAPTTSESATEPSNLEVATHEVPIPETTTPPWPKLSAPQKSDKSQVTSRQSTEDIVRRLEKLLSVTAAPTYSPINTHPPPVSNDPFLGAAQPVEFALSGSRPNMAPSRLSSASLGMAVPDYADYALLSDLHRERLRPPPAWQGQAAPQMYNTPARPWEGELRPTGFQEPHPTIYSVPGSGPQNNYVGYSNNAVPYQGDINMMMVHLPDHTRLREPSFTNLNGPTESEVYPWAQGNAQPALGIPSQYPVLSIFSDVNLPSEPNQTLFGLRDLTPAQAATGAFSPANLQYPNHSTGRETYTSRPMMYAGPYIQIAQGASAVPPTQMSSPELPRIYNIHDNIIPETPYEKMRAKAFDEWKDALTKKKADAIRRANAAAAAPTTLTRPQRSTYIPGTESVFQRILQEGADSVTVPAHPTRPGLEGLRTDSPYVTPGSAGVPTVSEFDQALQEAKANAVHLPAIRPPRPGLTRRIQKRHTTVSTAHTPSLEETRFGSGGMMDQGTDSHYVTPGTAGVPTAVAFEESLRESRANGVHLPPVRPPRPDVRHTVQKRETTVHSAQTPSLEGTRLGSGGMMDQGTDSHYVTPGTAGVPTAAQFEESLRESRAKGVHLPPVRPPRPGLRHTVQKRETTVHSAQTPSLEETRPMHFLTKERSSHVSAPAPYLKVHESRETSTPAISRSGNRDEILHDHSQVHQPIGAVLPPNSLRKSNELRASYHGGEEVDARPFRNSSQDDAEIIVPVTANRGPFTVPKRFPVLTNATIMRIVFPHHKNSEFSNGRDFPDSNFSSPKKWLSAKVDGVESPMLTALLQSNFGSQAATSPGSAKHLQFASKSAPQPVSKLVVALQGAARDCEDGKCKTCQSWNCVHSSKGEDEIHLRRKRSDHVISDAFFAHQLSFFGS